MANSGDPSINGTNLAHYYLDLSSSEQKNTDEFAYGTC